MTSKETKGAASAVERWREMVQAEHAQSDRRRDLSVGDQWAPFASRFRPAPDADVSEDPQFQAIARRIQPQHTVLDVGAGGGRLAIPLAQRCRRVIAVEPAQSMGEVLRDAAARAGMADRIELASARWEVAEVEEADVVLCSHVLYTIADIAPFVRKMERHARERVIVVLFAAPPIAHARPFWERVYGEERLQLPGLPEFVEVLWEMGVYPDVEMLATRRGGRFSSWEEARDTLRARLYTRMGSPEDARLEEAMGELLQRDATDGAYWVRGIGPQRPGLITWTPGGAAPQV
jgi:SAM-dependent methyltransferase